MEESLTDDMVRDILLKIYEEFEDVQKSQRVSTFGQMNKKHRDREVLLRGGGE